MVVSELKSNISTLRTDSLIIPENRVDEFDRIGTELWNISSRLRLDSSDNIAKLVTLLRVFAFFLLDCVKEPTRRTYQNNARLLKAANKAARLCLEVEDHESAQNVLARAALCEEAIMKPLQDVSGHEGDAGGSQWALEVDYLSLRIMLVNIKTVHDAALDIDTL